MRKVVYYEAFDETNFNTEWECVDYEVKYFDLLIDFCKCYKFFDKEKNLIPVTCVNEIEETIDALDYAYQTCECVQITGKVEKPVMDFVTDYFGFIFPDGIGMFRYDLNEGEWVKEGE